MAKDPIDIIKGEAAGAVSGGILSLPNYNQVEHVKTK